MINSDLFQLACALLPFQPEDGQPKDPGRASSLTKKSPKINQKVPIKIFGLACSLMSILKIVYGALK